mmetsp:Transcript_19259/g.42817  ORF Transcript_19259/g.42817 Transcript_19259/m.42817 type:complete len:313 (+) Transcript_19259:1276-2214(+)
MPPLVEPPRLLRLRRRRDPPHGRAHRVPVRQPRRGHGRHRARLEPGGHELGPRGRPVREVDERAPEGVHRRRVPRAVRDLHGRGRHGRPPGQGRARRGVPDDGPRPGERRPHAVRRTAGQVPDLPRRRRGERLHRGEPGRGGFHRHMRRVRELQPRQVHLVLRERGHRGADAGADARPGRRAEGPPDLLAVRRASLPLGDIRRRQEEADGPAHAGAGGRAELVARDARADGRDHRRPDEGEGRGEHLEAGDIRHRGRVAPAHDGDGDGDGESHQGGADGVPFEGRHEGPDVRHQVAERVLDRHGNRHEAGGD